MPVTKAADSEARNTAPPSSSGLPKRFIGAQQEFLTARSPIQEFFVECRAEDGGNKRVDAHAIGSLLDREAFGQRATPDLLAAYAATSLVVSFREVKPYST